MKREELSALTCRMQEERRKLGEHFRLPVLLDLDSALYVIATLQLALRHTNNKELAAEVAGKTIHEMISRLREVGYRAHAELAELRDDPRFNA